jgi:putative CocE/NonD family hydrolase
VSLVKLCLLLAWLALGGLTNLAVAQAPSPTPASHGEYDVRWGVKIPMRDRVELNATLYLPREKEAGARNPVIFTLTPYISDTCHERGAYFASHGYPFALVDARGRGNSAGEFVTFVNEGHDGHDVVEWLAQQSFCDGHVAMWGGSYAGFGQWSTAKELPPHLSTIVPAAAVHPGIDAPHYNNIGQPYVVQWLTLTNGHAGQESLFADRGYWRSKFLAAYRQHIPFKSLDTFVGTPFPNFQRFIQHPARDAYYDALTPSAGQFKKITIPILTITGQYDGDEYGALTYYRDHLANISAETRGRHFLVIGPWDHPGTRSPTDEVDGVKFGPGALLDLNDLHRQWYDWTMKKGPKPAFLKKQVAYYLLAAGNTGANGEWRYADSFADLTTSGLDFYLDSKDGDANGAFHSGTLSESQPKGGADHFTYDPLDTNRGEALEGVEQANKSSRLDQSYALSIGKDGLVYHSSPLPTETEFVGCPRVRLWLSLDTPDTDLQVDLAEIQPDGTSVQLWTDSRRLRYRESASEGKLVKPGEIVACDFAPGLFVARKLMKGGRLRLVVSSPISIGDEKNYNSGGVVAEETTKDARPAHIQVHHDAAHASVLQLHLAATANN